MGDAEEAFAEDAGAAAPDGGRDVAEVVGVAAAEEEAGLVDVDFTAEVGDGHTVEGDDGADAVEERGSEVDGGTAHVEEVGGGGADELGALLGVGEAEIHGGLGVGRGKEGGKGQEEEKQSRDPAQGVGRGRRP